MLLEMDIAKDTDRIEDSIDERCPSPLVKATTSIALRANRVLQIAMRETENSEDPVYVDHVNEAIQRLHACELMFLLNSNICSSVCAVITSYY